jgi:hypothetical protein
MMFESAFNIGDAVCVELGGKSLEGHIRAVTFSTGKVRYAVYLNCGRDMEEDCTTVHNIDSWFVSARPGYAIKFGHDNYAT